MKITQLNIIRHLTKKKYFQLRELCFFSNCLYSFELYNVRQQYFKDRTFLGYTINEPQCQNNDNYKLLRANIARQTLRDVDDTFKSFFGSLKSKKKARLPKYREKGGLYTLTIAGNSINVKDGDLFLPSSRTYAKVLNDHKIKIRFPDRLIGKKINEVKIILQYRSRYFKIAYCYEIDDSNLNLNHKNSLSIDTRLDNLATCVTDAGNTDFKGEINLRIMTNQNFTQISFGALRKQLKYLCQRYGTEYIEQEESYTSKLSF